MLYIILQARRPYAASGERACGFEMDAKIPVRDVLSTPTGKCEELGVDFWSDVCEDADWCIAKTIARTSRLQKLLTSHISATTLHHSARSLSCMNQERCSLMSVRYTIQVSQHMAWMVHNFASQHICTSDSLQNWC